MAGMQTPRPGRRPVIVTLRVTALLSLALLVAVLVVSCSPPLAAAIGDSPYVSAGALALQVAAAAALSDGPVDAPAAAQVLPTEQSTPATAVATATATAVPPTEAPPPTQAPAVAVSLTPMPPTPVPPTSTPVLPTPLPTNTPVPPAPAAPPVQLASAPAVSSPTRIEAPSIGLDVPVVDMGYTVIYIEGRQATGWQVPNDAAGFQQGSALPGNPGNTVIVGHSNVAGKVFLSLPNLNIGDRILVYVGSQAYQYEVTQKEIVQEEGVSIEQRIENARWIAPTEDERLTLVTCWPPTGAAERLIVVARPVAS